MADEIKQVLGFDASQCFAELTKLDGAMVQFQHRLSSTVSTLSVFNKNAGKTVSAFIQLGKHGNAAASALAAVSAGQNNPAANLNAASTAAAQLAVSLQQAGVTGQSASVKIGSAMVRLGKQSNQTANAVQQSSVRMTTSLQLLSRVVYTQAIVRALSTLRNSFKSTANEAADFQRSISLIRTIDDSKQSADALSKSVRNLSDQFNIPLLEASAGLYQSISNQVGNAAESLEFAAKSAEFAKATNSSLANSVDLLSGVLKSYSLNVSETDRVSSVFFKTVDLGRVNADELANSFGRIGPRASDMGISIEETGAALASLTVRGLKTTEAITQLSGILTALAKPSDAMKEAFKALGVASGQAAIQTFGLFGTLQKLKSASGGSAAEMARLFPNVRALGGATSLLGDGLKSATANLNEMNAAGRDFAHNKFLEATANDGERVRKEFNEIKNVFVTEVGGALIVATKRFLETTNATQHLTAAINASVPAVDNIVAVIGLLISQLAAAKLGAAGLGKALGALALVPVAQGAGELLGDKLSQIVNANRNAGLLALEESNAKEVQSFRDAQQQKVDAANVANQKILANTRQVADAMNRAFSADQIASALNNSSAVTSLESVVGGRQIDTMGKLAAATESVVNRIGELNQAIANAATASQQLNAVSSEVDTALASVRGTGNGTTGEFADGLRAQLATLKADLQTLANSSNITEQQLSEVIAKRNEFGEAALNGENPLVGKLGFAQDIVSLDQALVKLQQLKQLQATSTVDPGLQAQLTKLEQVLAQNPAGQFGGATQAMNAAVGPTNAIANAWERAAAAAERAARAAAAGAGSGGSATNQAFGGMMHLAAGGGARGIDTIPAMLSPGEFVMNAKSSRKFYSQLQAMNAGQMPAYREQGGSVTNYNVGDVVVNGAGNPAMTGEQIFREINRASRRGTGRLR